MDEAERRIDEVARTGKTELDLSGLGLTSLPQSLSRISHIEHLDVRNNKLKVIPDLRSLRKLRFLIAYNNQLTEFPQISPNNLYHLDVDNNQLTKLPDTISQFTQMNSLSLAGNKLLELRHPKPVSIFRLSMISCQLTSLPALPVSLTMLSISANKLKTLPEFLVELTKLEHLLLSTQ